MTFLRVHNLQNINPQGRLYEHSSGNEVFSNGENSVEHALKVMRRMNAEMFDYFIAISWGNSGKKMLDIFGYSGIGDDWKANPEIVQLIAKEGYFTNAGGAYRERTCGESLILLGREEEHRLKTKSLKEYLSTPLDINEINRIIGKNENE